MSTITTARIHVALCIQLHTIRYASVCVGKYATIVERLGLRVDVKGISVDRVQHRY